jgi:hypothetical protein
MVQRASVGLTPIVLHAIAPLVDGARRRPPPPPPPDGPFGRPPFRPMRLIRMRGDHVVAAVDGSIGDYAIGHLQPSARALVRAPGSISVTIADAKKRTMLGILSDKAINDIHDEDPSICPVALGIMRMYSRDAAATIRSYMACAPHVGSIEGQEFTADGESIVYQGSGRRLTVEWRGGNWSLLHDRIQIEARLPTTTCLSAIGKQLDEVLEHPAISGCGAVVTGTLPEAWGTEITFEAKGIRARMTEEADTRRTRR